MITFEETPSYQMITFLILLILFLIHLDNRLASPSMRLCVYAAMYLRAYRATELHSYTSTELRAHMQTVDKKERPGRRPLNSAGVPS